MKISKGTIVRTIMIFIVILNFTLEKMGIDVIKTDENMVLQIVECFIEIASVIAAWWYNNSFSKKALAAQKYLEKLKGEGIDV